MIDANLIIGAYWNRSSSSWHIIEGCIDGRWEHFYTKRIKREIFRILNNIHARQKYAETIETLYKRGQEITHTRRLRIVKDDPDDDKYLECADASSARYVVTNDRHLLELKCFHEIEVVRPAQFVKRHNNSEQE